MSSTSPYIRRRWSHATRPSSPLCTLPGVAQKVSQMDRPRPSRSTPPSIWYADVAAPHRKPAGKAASATRAHFSAFAYVVCHTDRGEWQHRGGQQFERRHRVNEDERVDRGEGDGRGTRPKRMRLVPTQRDGTTGADTGHDARDRVTGES